MEVSRLPISASLRAKLISAGYSSLASLSSLSSTDLARELAISDTEAQNIQKFASYNSRLATISSNGISADVNVAQTAWDLLHEEQLVPRITTSCPDLDSILGGGINCGEVTEIGGVPGIGKTQLGIQLAVNVQIPVEYGGLGGKAVYIDTEGSFMLERVIQIAEACLEDMLEYRVIPRKDLHSCQSKLQLNDILENIYYFRICSYTEQIALINFLDKFITEHKDVKVVIVDSIAFHFRQDFDDLALRTRLLGEVSLKLMKLSKKFNLAVVLFNQATIKYTEGAFQLALALGDSWSNYCTNRVILYWNGDDRYAYIDKSPSLRSASTPYSITSRGIRNSSSSYKRIKT